AQKKILQGRTDCGTSNSCGQGPMERTGSGRTAWWCAWPRQRTTAHKCGKPATGARLWRSWKSRLGVLARREAVVRTPGSPVGVAGGGVDEACLVRRPRRELVRVGEESCASGGRTAISRAVRGAPNRQCGIAAARVLEARCGLQSRQPGGDSRRGRGETQFTRCPRRASAEAAATPSGDIGLRRRN